jgi:integrase
MPRRSKGPRLAINDRGMWIIRDGQNNRGTGCYERDRAGAEVRLAEYLLGKHDPAQEIESVGNPNQAAIADVISVEMRRISARTDLAVFRKNEFINLFQAMGNWFAERDTHYVGQLNGKIQRQYAEERGFKSAAYRDLKLLAAAINRNIPDQHGGVQTKFRPVLPEGSQPRKGFFRTRDEAARFTWTAYRLRRTGTGEYQWRHIARYALVGLYTGSRHTDICNAALMPTIGRGYIDVETGTFRRKPDNKKETSKKQPTVPVHPKLLAHIRRWQRKGISESAVVEYRGKPVGAVKSAWATVAEAAGFSTDKNDPYKIIRHSLRHSAITWFLTGLHNREQPVRGKGRKPGKGIDIEIVSQYCGVSPATIRKHYRHETDNTYDDILGRQSG